MAILPMVLLTMRDKALAFSLKVIPLSPWMIFATPTFTPKAFASASASNAAISLFARNNLFAGTKRIGVNSDDWSAPSNCVRWTA
jgi:hypothetical protein